MKFIYRYGQKPLDGYTIRRGLGKGGFGEVYLAVSDGGKEVALKLIRNHSEIEVRGIRSCLNLKHPHLIHLYDLRQDVRGDRWLSMEYVQGESLSQVLNRHRTNGLPQEQARTWFLQAASAIAYLHSHGIVHRDIKPGNLFIELDQIKVGDYGLSKPMSANSMDQSVNVGTVYYMAPEIHSGNYSRQVDIYSLGVTLYEMLTGRLPFEGQTFHEIILKHQIDHPDMSRVPEKYMPIIVRALKKDPSQRYASVEEMIREIENLEVTTSVIAAALAETTAHPSAVLQAYPNIPQQVKPVTLQPGAMSSATMQAYPPAMGKIRELLPSLTWVPILAGFVMCAIAIHARPLEVGHLASLAIPMVLMSWLGLLISKPWDGQSHGAPLGLQLMVGAILGFAIYWLNGWPIPQLLWQPSETEALPVGMETFLGGRVAIELAPAKGLSGYVLYFAFLFGLLPWSAWLSRHREQKFAGDPLVVTMMFAGLLWIISWLLPVPHPSMLLIAPAAVGIAQIASPIHPKPDSSRPKKQRLEPRVP